MDSNRDKINTSIDWGNPDDPRTKQAIQEILNILNDDVLIELEMKQFLVIIYLEEIKIASKDYEDLLHQADHEMKIFWKNLREDASRAIKTNDRNGLEECLKKVTTKIDIITSENNLIVNEIKDYKKNISINAAEFKIRQVNTESGMIKILKDKYTDRNGKPYSEAGLKELFEISRPKDIDERFGQVDYRTKFKALVKDLKPDEENQVFSTAAKCESLFQNIRMLGDGGLLTNLKPSETKAKDKQLSTARAQVNEASKLDVDAMNATAMQAIFNDSIKIEACEKKHAANIKKITTLESLKPNLETSIKKMFEIPDAPPPPPFSRPRSGR